MQINTRLIIPEFFFVLGTPRSRTAWLANWLTTGASLCLHDAWRGTDSVEALRQKLLDLKGGQPLEYVGNSDSSNTLHYWALKATFPDARFALIERPIDEVVVSAETIGYGDTGELRRLLEVEEEIHRRIKEEDSIYTTTFAQLEIPEVIRDMQKHLTPDILFNPDRLDMLSKLRVTIHEDKYFSGGTA